MHLLRVLVLANIPFSVTAFYSSNLVPTSRRSLPGCLCGSAVMVQTRPASVDVLHASPKAAPIRIRSFNRATDEAAVHVIFAEGMMQMVSSGFAALFNALAPLVAAACAILSAVAWSLGVGPVATVLAFVVPLSAAMMGLRLYLARMIRNYVDKSISDDLADIDGFYMATPKSHFWVAVVGEKDGGDEVLGCVALESKSDSEDNKDRRGWGELRRMSVAKSGRRRGVASLLNAALLAHAHQQHLKGVFLSTSTMQPDAIALYSRLEYKQVSLTPFPNRILERAIQFALFEKAL